MKSCVICEKVGERLVLVTDRGKSSLKEFSKLRQNSIVLSRLEDEDEIFVHENCRKWFNNKKRIESDQRKFNVTEQTHNLETRTLSKAFTWGSDCFLCGKEIKKKENSHMAQTLDLRGTILNDCEIRLEHNKNEPWAMDVKARVTQCFDLVSSGARYHQSCREKFSIFKSTFSSSEVGRPADIDKNSIFISTCEWLERVPDVKTVSDFAKKMKDFSEIDECYTTKHIKTLLEQKYGSKVTFKCYGKENLI